MAVTKRKIRHRFYSCTFVYKVRDLPPPRLKNHAFYICLMLINIITPISNSRKAGLNKQNPLS